jgi:hypothetical protein
MRAFIALTATAALAAGPALAADSATHASAAVTASGQAVANLAEAGIQTIAGTVALPVGVAGGLSEATGQVAAASGESLKGSGGAMRKSADQAIEDAWGPLKVDDRIVVKPDPKPAVPYAPQGSHR